MTKATEIPTRLRAVSDWACIIVLPLWLASHAAPGWPRGPWPILVVESLLVGFLVYASLRQRLAPWFRLHDRLDAALAAKEEACDLAIGPHDIDWQSLGDRVHELRGVGK
jgi:hypothetical protein